MTESRTTFSGQGSARLAAVSNEHRDEREEERPPVGPEDVLDEKAAIQAASPSGVCGGA